MASGDTFHHIRDSVVFELPSGSAHPVEVPLPEVFGLQITKFMVLQLVAFALTFLIFRGLARRVQQGGATSGRWWNFWEMLALYIRDNVVRPTIGVPHHDHEDGHDHGAEAQQQETTGHPADAYLPFVWSCFFYILFCNLLGAVPWLGSPTGEINVTGVLAVVTFGMVVVCGSRETGIIGFWKSLVPGMELPGVMKYILVPMIWVIELFGLFVKHGVLCIRLFANIMAGHTVIAVFLGFIAATAGSGLWWAVTPASIAGQVGIGLLELFVAFLQAYVFAFLATLFISMAIHPH